MEIKEAHAAHIAVMYYSRNVPVPEQMEALFPDFHESWRKEQGQRLRDNYMEFFAMLDGPDPTQVHLPRDGEVRGGGCGGCWRKQGRENA